MYRPIYSDHDPEWHLRQFREFDRLKAELGEPTPHMEVIRWMARGASEEDRLWLAGCYAAGYSVLTAEAIWREWPYDRGVAGLDAWVRENWAGIHTRTPRRAVRTPEKFITCLLGYRDWMEKEPLLHGIYGYDAPYADWWEAANTVPFMGRYIVIRLLELLRRWDFLTAELPDIRAMDAESPVRCLALFTPEAADALLSGDTATADTVAHLVLDAASSDRSYFRFAALLCEYRKSYEKRGDYPGNQTDEELGYTYGKHADWWRSRGFESNLFAARAEQVPYRARGEVGRRWAGQRPFAAGSLRAFGLNWSDLRYDYLQSVAAGRPVAWT